MIVIGPMFNFERVFYGFFSISFPFFLDTYKSKFTDCCKLIR